MIKKLRELTDGEMEAICNKHDCTHCPLSYFPYYNKTPLCMRDLLDAEVETSEDNHRKVTSFPTKAFYKDETGRIFPITLLSLCGTPTDFGRYDRYHGVYNGDDMSLSVVVHEDKYGSDWAFTKNELSPWWGDDHAKALKIVEEKQVNVEYLIEVVKQFRLNPNEKISLWKVTDREGDKKEEFSTELELYNRTCMYGCNHLTQEEFDLLEEVLA